ncbi:MULTISPECIES: glycine cleavage system protein GcvH [Haloferax]|jgi:glycine cleavage system H protein|uniref:Glycine cleavage system protein GcvH n=4 Tax=Haloferax TaxID=2251 RepID=A0ACD5HUH9_9EURY|nr:MULTISPECIES: glycine cleavage system protein GcvH [Haloferax]ELK51332.1 glycine cleavage system protein H [Haloferax sp. BAB-2207]ELZ76183.1 glycine cleavage system protein H [Haloferax lucentense DSM 14919]ELZ87093.1 glycine cleavage system protein H [Haloferax alexandrinus JCM 10717]MBC9987090.1 glycine cleavage system protein GcvH [Haloferax sp. AS1]NLV03983.1 glycine cleavage system protein GcvH [Haloferax alexandrinus]
MFEIPDDRKYLESHEWTTTEGDAVRIGISDFAQDELGDVVFVELPAEGDELAAGEEFGVVESIKAVSDLYAPISGTVTAVNEELFDAPELLNDDPYGDGWMLEVEPADESEFDDLLAPEEYREQTE